MAKYHGYGIRVSGDGRGDGEYPGGRTLREARKEAAKFVEYRTQGHMRSSADVKILGYDRESRAYIVDLYEGHIDKPNRSGGTKRGLARRARQENDLRRLSVAVGHYAHTGKGLKIGKKFGALTVTAIGEHTVNYITRDGWSGTLQIPFINAHGEQTAHHRSLMSKYGY